jgi:hypothetical protein
MNGSPTNMSEWIWAIFLRHATKPFVCLFGYCVTWDFCICICIFVFMARETQIAQYILLYLAMKMSILFMMNFREKCRTSCYFYYSFHEHDFFVESAIPIILYRSDFLIFSILPEVSLLAFERLVNRPQSIHSLANIDGIRGHERFQLLSSPFPLLIKTGS